MAAAWLAAWGRQGIPIVVLNLSFPIVRRPVLALLALALCASAWAQPVRPDRAHRAKPPPQWRGDISRFHEHDWGVWRSGRWVHDRHAGRLGWWWVAGGLWYFYPVPVYPYPNPWEPAPPWVNPPAMVTPPLPPADYWYWCDASKAYYPYVAHCAGGWKQVPATPADVKPVPPK